MKRSKDLGSGLGLNEIPSAVNGNTLTRWVRFSWIIHLTNKKKLKVLINRNEWSYFNFMFHTSGTWFYPKFCSSWYIRSIRRMVVRLKLGFSMWNVQFYFQIQISMLTTSTKENTKLFKLLLKWWNIKLLLTELFPSLKVLKNGNLFSFLREEKYIR